MELAMGVIILLLIIGVVGFIIKITAQFFWLLISRPTTWLILIIIFLIMFNFF